VIQAALTIAGSDPSGGAGIQADLKTFHRFGVYGEAVITLLTVQNTRGVSKVEVMPPELIRAQIEAVISDIPPRAAKTGALGSREVIHTVAALADQFSFPLVVDPVMISKHGAPLISSDAVEALKKELLPRAALVTPNLPEAAALSDRPVDSVQSMRAAAEAIARLGAKAVLVKGGHLPGDAIDLLFTDGAFLEFRACRVATAHTHGTGCTYSAAITALLAQGYSLADATSRAKDFVTRAIASAPGLGAGTGPLNHWA
jgi:hydroxymethylpyrimidine/phosphomethylpyrimidine kinase